MTVREELERLEHRKLNPKAAFADKSKGRPRPEPDREEDVRKIGRASCRERV